MYVWSVDTNATHRLYPSFITAFNATSPRTVSAQYAFDELCSGRLFIKRSAVASLRLTSNKRVGGQIRIVLLFSSLYVLYSRTRNRARSERGTLKYGDRSTNMNCVLLLFVRSYNTRARVRFTINIKHTIRACLYNRVVAIFHQSRVYVGMPSRCSCNQLTSMIDSENRNVYLDILNFDRFIIFTIV